MDLPPRLDDWDYPLICTIVATYNGAEPGPFDFKAVLTGRDGGYTASIRRTACAMANTAGGGYILFGVKDPKNEPGYGPETSPEVLITGIPFRGELRKEAGDKLNGIELPIRFETTGRPIAIDGNPERGVLVIRIPESPLRPHMVREVGIFYRRGDGGDAQPMGFTEVRDLMLYGAERLRKATLLHLRLLQFERFAARLEGYGRSADLADERFDTSGFYEVVADVAPIVPPVSSLLTKLVEVAEHANLINQRLNRGPRPTEATFFHAVASDAATLKRLSDECAVELDRLIRASGG